MENRIEVVQNYVQWLVLIFSIIVPLGSFTIEVVPIKNCDSHILKQKPGNTNYLYLIKSK